MYWRTRGAPLTDLGAGHADIVHAVRTIRAADAAADTPQVLLFGPKSRESQNLLLARAYHFQGLRDTDVVHSVYGFGMINGGHYIRETLLHWTRARFTETRQKPVRLFDARPESTL